MSSFIELTASAPVVTYAVVAPESVTYWVRTAMGKFQKCTELRFDPDIGHATPFVRAKHGWFRVEDGVLVSYSKKHGTRTKRRNDMLFVLCAYEQFVLAVASDFSVRLLSFSTSKVEKEAKLTFIDKHIVSATFVNKGANIVTLDETNTLKYYSLKACIHTFKIADGGIVTSLAGNGGNATFYFCTMTGVVSFVAKPVVTINRVDIDFVTNEIKTRVVGPVAFMAQLAVSGNSAFYYTDTTGCWTCFDATQDLPIPASLYLPDPTTCVFADVHTKTLTA